MTVAPAQPETTYALIGTNVGPFSTVFPYESEGDIAVYLDLGGMPTLLSAGSDYTQAGSTPLVNGGSVTLNAGLPGAGWPANAALLISRASPNGQPLALGEVTGFSPKAVEDELDEIARQIQELDAKFGRAMVRYAGAFQALGRPILGLEASTDPGSAVNLAQLTAAVGGGGTAAILAWLGITGIPPAVEAMYGQVPSNGKIFAYTGPTSGHMIDIPSAGAGLADVNQYLAGGDTNYDGAFARCLAANGHAYVPPTPALGGGVYIVTVPIVLQTGQSIAGDSIGVPEIRSSTHDQAVIKLASSMQWFSLRNLTLTHSGTAIAGGDGIQQGQGATDWVNDGRIDEVVCSKNYVGFNLGKAFYAEITNCEAEFNIREGFKFTTTGNSTVPVAVAAGGPMQWYLTDCLSGSNGWDGFSYNVSGTAFGGAGVGSSVGTIQGCKTYHNGHHGVAAYGSAAHPLNSIRVDGPNFFGEDIGSEIYLDAYGRNAVLRGTEIELAGNYGIDITLNNSGTVVGFKQISGCFWDGVISSGDNTIFEGGCNYVNNGVAGTGVENFAGINIAGGSATIGAVSSGNFNATYQQYGIRTAVDTLNIAGARLPAPGEFGHGGGSVNGAAMNVCVVGNNLGSIFWAVGPVDSVVSGCWPVAVNTGGVFSGGTIAGNLIVTGDVRTNTLHVVAASAFAGGVNITAGGMNFTTGIGGNGLTVDNISVNFSLGVGTPATGVAGQLKFGAAIGSTSLAAPLITSSSDIIANGFFHANGASAFAAGSTWTGSNSITVGGGVTAQDINATRSMGVGANSATGVAGQLGVGSAILIGTATGGYQANSVNVPTNFLINNVAVGGGGGGNAFTGDVTITAGRLLVGGVPVVSTTGVLNSSAGLTLAGAITGATNVTASGTLTVGTDLVSNGTTHLNGAITVAANMTFSGANSLTVGGTITATTDLIATTAFHCNGAAAFTAGGVNITAGGMNFTTGVAGNGITVDNITANKSIGVGTAATGVLGTLKLLPQLYGTLSPIGAAAGLGSLAFVSDSVTSGNYVAVSGGGLIPISVQFEGVNWRTP